MTAISINVLADEMLTQPKISVPKVIPKDVLDIIKLEQNQKVDPKKSLVWTINQHPQYFIPIQTGENDACIIIVVDEDFKKFVQLDEYDACKFDRTPKLIDLDRNGYLDIGIGFKKRSNVAPVYVSHHTAYIFVLNKLRFCKSNEAGSLFSAIEDGYKEPKFRTFDDVNCLPEQ